MLVGRRVERATLDRLVEDVHGGTGRALVVRGDPGVGKTELLDHIAERTTRRGCQLLRVAGVQSEMELAFAGLHHLCLPLMDRFDRLPPLQHAALASALGLAEGPTPDRMHVGLAVLSLLSAAGGRSPAICLVDDEQWLDESSAQVLGFVARRLLADSVGIVFGTREPGAELFGLPELHVAGLLDDEARTLLASALRAPLDERVRELLVAEARGNPLALLELPRGLSADELAGGFGLPGAGSLSRRIKDSFVRQLEAMPAATRRLMVLASADPSGDPSLVWRAARLLGLPKDAQGPALDAGLAELGVRVRFRHPLLRSAVYGSATPSEQRAAHAALGEATDASVDPDRRAWHRALAADGLDEDVATDLESSAGRAQRRGGLPAAAAFYERAALLTPDPARRAGRLLNAARAKHEAGAYEVAARLLDAAAEGPLGEWDAAALERLRGQIMANMNQQRRAGETLLVAARMFEPLSVDTARETYLEALWEISQWHGRRDGLRKDAASAARSAPGAGHPARPVDDLLDGLAVRFTDGFAAAAPHLRRAFEGLAAMDDSSEDVLRLLRSTSGGASCLVGLELSDFGAWDLLSARAVRVAREAGDMVVLELYGHGRALFHLNQGELHKAARLLEENDVFAAMTGRMTGGVVGMFLAAWRGDEAGAGDYIRGMSEMAEHLDAEVLVAYASLAGAVLNNGLARYQVAQEHGRQAFELDVFAVGPLVVPELLEAASRTENTALASAAAAWLFERADAAPTDWARGMAARARALLGEGDTSEGSYRESIELFSRTGFGAQRARAHLLFGEWLRRQNRRSDARAHLHTAYEMLSTMGAEGYAERARQELAAAGERVGKRSVQTSTVLTAQEALIARLARDGHTNLEIAAQLFLSSRTVQYHLKKVFNKLDISSRRELRSVLPSA
jgi:DNA-binding CsgD family transcriptional regulator